MSISGRIEKRVIKKLNAMQNIFSVRELVGINEFKIWTKRF
jgi:hypothetical protein